MNLTREGIILEGVSTHKTGVPTMLGEQEVFVGHNTLITWDQLGSMGDDFIAVPALKPETGHREVISVALRTEAGICFDLTTQEIHGKDEFRKTTRINFVFKYTPIPEEGNHNA